jgi:putative membrane protein
MFAGSYCGSPPALAEIASHWNFDPPLVAILAVAWVWALRARNRMAAVGVSLLTLAFVSPLCAASVSLFSARSIHHLLLIAAALAFALAARSPGAVSSPFKLRLPVSLTTLTMTGALWAWHVPALYNAALANMALYWGMQITIFATSFAFWLAIQRAGVMGAVGGLLGGMVQMGCLGALLTFASQPLYVTHALSAPSWGLTGLADQQLAGLVMWVGGMAPFAIGGLWIARRAWRRQNATGNSTNSINVLRELQAK